MTETSANGFQVLTQRRSRIHEISHYHNVGRPPSILSLNKESHPEAAEAFYKTTTFLLISEYLDFSISLPRASLARPHLVGWLSSIPSQYCRKIERIRVQARTRSVEEAMRMLQWYRAGISEKGLKLKYEAIWTMVGTEDRYVWVNEVGRQERD